MVHLPGSRACGPYSVYREKYTKTISSRTDAVSTVFLFGEYLTTDAHVSPIIGTFGYGAQVPGTNEGFVLSPYFTGAGAEATFDVSLHALTVSVQCLGTSGGLVPSGLVLVGVLPQAVDRVSYGTWDALGDAVVNRRGMHRFSASSLTAGGVAFGTYPLDIVAHTSMVITEGGTGAVTDVLSNGLCPLIVIIEPVTTAADYAITIHAEWKFRARLDPVLVSTHRVHAPAPETTWAKVMHLGQQTSGLLSSVATAAQGLQKAGAVIGPAVSRAGVAIGLA